MNKPKLKLINDNFIIQWAVNHSDHSQWDEPENQW